jgi:cytochrome c biogenesis protein
MFGFTGEVLIVEGERWKEAPIGYNTYDPGLFGGNAHRGFEIVVDSFDVRFRDDGSAADFVSSVRVFEGDRQVKEKEIRVNDPLDYRGVKMFQAAFGWAPRITITDSAGTTIFDDFVPTFPDGPRNTWKGVVKLPSVRPQTAFEVYLFPTAEILTPEQADLLDDELGPGVRLRSRPGPPTDDNPFVLMREYRGDLGLDDGPQNVFELDTSRLGAPVGLGLAQLEGNRFQFDGGLIFSFPELRHYTGLQVKRDPGLGLVFSAAVLLFAGLVPSLYVSRRRLWLWVRPSFGSQEGALIAFGGLAYHKKDAFRDEFTDLVTEMRKRVPPTARLPSQEQASDGPLRKDIEPAR